LAVIGNDFLFAKWYNAGDPSRWEPDNVNNSCVVMDPLYNYNWFDAGCTSSHAYVCQRG